MPRSAQAEQLDRVGYLVLPEFMAVDRLAAIRFRVEELYEQEGSLAGSEFRQEPNTRRLANLVNKGEIFERVVADGEILEHVATVLGARFKLSSLNARSADPHSDSAQPLHCDMGAVADQMGYWVCNTVWMLDDFTADNGAIRVVPGSHKWAVLPQTALSDAWAFHPEEVLVTGPAGTVAVMNAHAWHSGTANRTDEPRRALHAFYCRSDKPQQQYQKALVSSAIQQRLSPDLRRILALDDSLNDELSSCLDRASGFLK